MLAGQFRGLLGLLGGGQLVHQLGLLDLLQTSVDQRLSLALGLSLLVVCDVIKILLFESLVLFLEDCFHGFLAHGHVFVLGVHHIESMGERLTAVVGLLLAVGGNIFEFLLLEESLHFGGLHFHLLGPCLHILYMVEVVVIAGSDGCTTSLLFALFGLLKSQPVSVLIMQVLAHLLLLVLLLLKLQLLKNTGGLVSALHAAALALLFGCLIVGHISGFQSLKLQLLLLRLQGLLLVLLLLCLVLHRNEATIKQRLAALLCIHLFGLFYCLVVLGLCLDLSHSSLFLGQILLLGSLLLLFADIVTGKNGLAAVLFLLGLANFLGLTLDIEARLQLSLRLFLLEGLLLTPLDQALLLLGGCDFAHFARKLDLLQLNLLRLIHLLSLFPGPLLLELLGFHNLGILKFNSGHPCGLPSFKSFRGSSIGSRADLLSRNGTSRAVQIRSRLGVAQTLQRSSERNIRRLGPVDSHLLGSGEQLLGRRSRSGTFFQRTSNRGSNALKIRFDGGLSSSFRCTRTKPKYGSGCILDLQLIVYVFIHSFNFTCNQNNKIIK